MRVANQCISAQNREKQNALVCPYNDKAFKPDLSCTFTYLNSSNINVPSHEKTCINDIKCDFLFLHTSCISNCAEQMLKISCSYLVYLLWYEHSNKNTIVKFERDVKTSRKKMTSKKSFLSLNEVLKILKLNNLYQTHYLFLFTYSV